MASKERLNSNIYKNIFPEDVIDLDYIEQLRQSTVSSYNEIKYPNHGFNVRDVILQHKWIEREYIEIYRDIMEDIMEDIFETCPNLTACSISLSYSNNGYLNTSTKQEKVRITINGGVDAWDRSVSKTLIVTGAYSLTQVGVGIYDAVFTSPGTFTATVECKSVVSSLPVVRNVQTITILNANGTSTSSGSFVGTSLDSGWLPASIEKGSFIDTYSFSLQVSSGHGSSYDNMYVLGKTTNGQIYVISDFFNASNNMKLQSSVTLGQGNLSSSKRVLSGTLALTDDIRQICFKADSPGHASCVTGASISFNYSLCYNESLYNKDTGISGSTSGKTVSWTVTGSSTDLSTQRKIGERKIGERKIGEEFVRTDLVNENIYYEYEKALASPDIFTDPAISTRHEKTIYTCNDERKIVGIVIAVKSKDVFSVIEEGQIDWPVLNFTDTTILYLSDKIPGAVCHYKDIDNLTYVPIAIYTDEDIIINIIQGTTGAPFAPYDKDEDTPIGFEKYTSAELNEVISTVKGWLT